MMTYSLHKLHSTDYNVCISDRLRRMQRDVDTIRTFPWRDEDKFRKISAYLWEQDGELAPTPQRTILENSSEGSHMTILNWQYS
jgi:hypothetical protein